MLTLHKLGPQDPTEHEHTIVNITTGIVGVGLQRGEQQQDVSYRWQLQPHIGFGRHPLFECMLSDLGHTGVFDAGGECEMLPGRMLIHDANSPVQSGTGILMMTSGGSGAIFDNIADGTLRIPLTLSAHGIRETHFRDAYLLHLSVVMRLDEDQTTNLTLRVQIAAQEVASQSTFLPPQLPAPSLPPPLAPLSIPPFLPSPPLLPDLVQPASSLPLCLCDNTCENAPNDYACDDGGPGAAFSLCQYGSDCADCGPRSEADHNTTAPSSNAGCLPADARELLCDTSSADAKGCTLLGLQAVPLTSIAASCRARSDNWVPGPFSARFWALSVDTQCALAFDLDSPRAIRISSVGCGVDASEACHVCCSVGSPALPPSLPPPPVLPPLNPQPFLPVPPPPPPEFDRRLSEDRSPAAAANEEPTTRPPFTRQLTHFPTHSQDDEWPPELPTHSLGNVLIGLFDPDSFTGTTFEFVMRDRDGLPIVNEAFDGVTRLSRLRAELVFEGVKDRSQKRIVPLKLAFVGNKERADGITYREPFSGDLQAPRSQHGRVQVTVEVFDIGLHHICAHCPFGPFSICSHDAPACDRCAPCRMMVLSCCLSLVSCQTCTDARILGPRPSGRRASHGGLT